jgi:hypothetical protein
MRTTLRPATLLLAVGVTLATANDVVREEAPETGTRLRQEISGGKRIYPLNKPYENFTAEEKAKFKSMYSDMGDDDEPTFPMRGLGPLIQRLSVAAGRAGYKGIFSINIVVRADGKPAAVELLKVTDPQAARSLAAVFFGVDYKPGRCAGQPCEMKLQLTFDLR